MKKMIRLLYFGITVCIVFFLMLSVRVSAQSLDWNTFMGSVSSSDEGLGIILDQLGNVYVTGESYATWGSPVNPHAGSSDAFVAKFDSDGELVWNTFMGSADYDAGEDIAVDQSGNVYVTGYSWATWGSPVNPHAGDSDAFVVKLNGNGNLVWNTFMGSVDSNPSRAITIDQSGNVYVAGTSWATWGSPVNPYAGGEDAFVAQLDGSGNLVWNTFMGSGSEDRGKDITLDQSGNVYVTGYSRATWGSPVNPHAGDYDVFAAELDGSGNLVWNTFIGSVDIDIGYGVAVDQSGNVYVTGESWLTWSSPVNPHAGDYDVFVAELDGSGNLVWNTFIGSAHSDSGHDIAVDQSGKVYVTGYSRATWGSPVNPHAGWYDAFVTGLDGSGNLVWNTFMGSANNEWGFGIAIDQSGNMCVTGESCATWGSPVNPYAGVCDAFVARLNAVPVIVTLSAFDAVPEKKHVVITWTTEAEINNAGFNLFRTKAGDWEYVQINTDLIPAAGSPTEGSEYEFVDDDVQNRKTYWYMLEDIDFNGKATLHGPVSATPRLIYGD